MQTQVQWQADTKHMKNKIYYARPLRTGSVTETATLHKNSKNEDVGTSLNMFFNSDYIFVTLIV